MNAVNPTIQTCQTNSGYNNECPVCLNSTSDMQVITQCGHRFHKWCLDKSREVNPRCPICRSPLPDSISLFMTQIGRDPKTVQVVNAILTSLALSLDRPAPDDSTQNPPAVTSWCTIV
ncbi:RING finger domain-containing protein [Salinisphaera sp. G21_0]|uniref:RING finger domain-containing protein n=1 Tax=Salinisphaera sp. G21_0 TaxID=2821094 RepID=UPI001B1F65A2|nr:hypothetical protein [Salinisphaera sp. G21_0]